MCVSAAGPQELSWDRTVDDGRVVCMDVVTPRRRLKPSTTQPSSARRLSGADATPTTTAVVGEVSELGRVPSGPWPGQAGMAGPENRISTFMYELLAQRAEGEALCAVILNIYIT